MPRPQRACRHRLPLLLQYVCTPLPYEMGSLCPETAILTPDFVHPTPQLGYAKVEDVVAAFVSAITDTNPKSNFGCYLIPDQWGVYRMNTHGQL